MLKMTLNSFHRQFDRYMFSAMQESYQYLVQELVEIATHRSSPSKVLSIEIIVTGSRVVDPLSPYNPERHNEHASAGPRTASPEPTRALLRGLRCMPL